MMTFHSSWWWHKLLLNPSNLREFLVVVLLLSSCGQFLLMHRHIKDAREWGPICTPPESSPTLCPVCYRCLGLSNLSSVSLLLSEMAGLLLDSSFCAVAWKLPPGSKLGQSWDSPRYLSQGSESYVFHYAVSENYGFFIKTGCCIWFMWLKYSQKQKVFLSFFFFSFPYFCFCFLFLRRISCVILTRKLPLTPFFNLHQVPTECISIHSDSINYDTDFTLHTEYWLPFLLHKMVTFEYRDCISFISVSSVQVLHLYWIKSKFTTP